MTNHSSSEKAQIRLGTRGSPLALAQAHEVAGRLRAAHPALDKDTAIEIVVIKTTGDKIRDRPLSEIGGKGLFTKEIEEALLDGRIDVAVHSMKDVPTWLPDGLEISVILPREDPRDAWFSRGEQTLAELPAGALVGTASLRRQALVKLARPDLRVQTLRGNVGTRMKKLKAGEVDATLLAVAGLNRLGLAAQMTCPLGIDEMLPAVAQGAIGLETRQGDEATLALVQPLDHAESHWRVTAERACLAELDGSCRTPIAAYGEIDGQNGTLRLQSLIALPDGSAVVRDSRAGPIAEAAALGKAAGEALEAGAQTSDAAEAFKSFFAAD